MTRHAPTCGILLFAALAGCGTNSDPEASDEPGGGDPGDTKADSTAAGTGRSTPRPDLAPPPGCTVRQDGATTVTRCVVDETFGGVPLRWELQRTEHKPAGVDRTGYFAESTTVIKSGAQLVLQLQQRSGPSADATTSGDLMAAFTYGPLVRGITSASLVTTNGRVAGSVNGRAIVPARAPVTAGRLPGRPVAVK